eukprot:1443802-Lingulodinium_polyedra.AAC.1
MRARRTATVPPASGGLANHGAGHHRAKRARRVGRKPALGEQPGARVPVDPVRQVSHVLAPGGD